MPAEIVVVDLTLSKHDLQFYAIHAHDQPLVRREIRRADYRSFLPSCLCAS
jgi:hypothetical protein